MQWVLRPAASAFGVRAANIQVGTLAGGGWYVLHSGFGIRLFADKQESWYAVRSLMGRHEGSWEETSLDDAPFLETHPVDGSRVLYHMNEDDSLYDLWGTDAELTWNRFLQAFGAGERLRLTETHALRDGAIELVRYRDPLAGLQRYAVLVADDPGSDCYVVDYPEREQADAAYEAFVYEIAEDGLPFRSSDIIDVPVSRRSKPPPDLHVIPDGTIMSADDTYAYNEMYGLPSRLEWPPTVLAPSPAGPVSAMTAEPRAWGPEDVRVQDVTPAAWLGSDEELRPNALALAALPDGRQFLASAHDGAAHVWSAGDGTKVCTVSGHSEWVLSVALTALSDGRIVLATGGKDRLARIWSARDGEALAEIEWHDGPVNSLAWVCPPGYVPWLVTGGDDAKVRVWDVETRLTMREFEVGKARVDVVCSVAAAVLSDGGVCVAAGVEDFEAAKVLLWNASTRTTLHEFVIDCAGSMSSAPEVAVATLADRSFRVAAIAGPTVRVWDGHSGQVVRSFPAPAGSHGGDVALAVLPDLRVVVAASRDRETLVWDVESGTVLARLEDAAARFPPSVSVVPRPDGGLLVATGRGVDGPARLLRIDARW
jgi:WD40 repeat protein